MKKQAVIYSVAGLALGLLIAGAASVLAVNNDNRTMMRMMGMNMSRVQDSSAGHMGMSMDDMTRELTMRTGDDFDAAFIEMMIAHHQGAIDMAHAASERAKHDEIKELAKDIIDAQSDEMSDMRRWQREWGYDTNNDTHMMH